MTEKLKNVASAEELMTLARENGFEMSEAEAENAFAQIRNGKVELSDDDLDKVAGGSIWTFLKAWWEGKL